MGPDTLFALEVLDKAPYVTVSFTRPDGTPSPKSPTSTATSRPTYDNKT